MSETLADSDVRNGTFESWSHRHPGSWQNFSDQDQQLVSDTDYSLGKQTLNTSLEIDSTIQSDFDLLWPSDRGIPDCFATGSVQSEQSAVRSHAGDAAEAEVPPSLLSAKTKKRRRLSGPTKEKAKSVRRVGACLRCRVYKESVCFSFPMIVVADMMYSVTKTHHVTIV